MTTRAISIFLLVVGLLWGIIVTGLFAFWGGCFGNAPPSDPVLIGKGLLSVWWMFIGPLLMVVGSILVLKDAHSRVGTLFTLLGCGVLTVTVGYQIVQMLHNASDPLVGKLYSLDAIYAVAVLLTIVADAGAVQLYRLTSLASRIPL
jgi:hypothetical protein